MNIHSKVKNHLYGHWFIFCWDGLVWSLCQFTWGRLCICSTMIEAAPSHSVLCFLSSLAGWRKLCQPGPDSDWATILQDKDKRKGAAGRGCPLLAAHSGAKNTAGAHRREGRRGDVRLQAGSGRRGAASEAPAGLWCYNGGGAVVSSVSRYPGSWLGLPLLPVSLTTAHCQVLQCYTGTLATVSRTGQHIANTITQCNHYN